MEHSAQALRAEGFDPLPSVAAPSAVYALVDRGVVVYIGQARNVYQRVTTHMRAPGRQRAGRSTRFLSPGDIKGRGMPFDSVLVRWTAVADLDEVERTLILRFRPRYNERVVAPVRRVRIDLLSLGLMERRAPGEVRRRRVA